VSEWKLEIAPKVEKEIKKLPPSEQARVKAALNLLLTNPERTDLKKMADQGTWRLRIGRWRALLRVDFKKKEISVTGFGPRGDVYK
jgi:mRNA interferase RelE/StbE